MIPTIKKYGKYVAILVVAAAAIVLWVAIKRWVKGKDKPTDDGSAGLAKVLNETKAKMTEASQVATVEIAAARTEEATIKTRLAEVVQIENPQERRDKLLALYQEVSK